MSGFATAVEYATFIIMGFVIGTYIDSKQGTRPWGSIIGFFLGAALGILSVKRAVAEFEESERRRKRRK